MPARVSDNSVHSHTVEVMDEIKPLGSCFTPTNKGQILQYAIIALRYQRSRQDITVFLMDCHGIMFVRTVNDEDEEQPYKVYYSDQMYIISSSHESGIGENSGPMHKDSHDKSITNFIEIIKATKSWKKPSPQEFTNRNDVFFFICQLYEATTRNAETHSVFKLRIFSLRTPGRCRKRGFT
ncbi:8789_t:CDS:1 [Paraglomus brasilianum]|uniref:8789_t:CDS:1 n=1 Tax=Paraglomus brasilianum TaxID=144538 RepID=A0A9N9GF49_9GLOM|nr:8789_t:CDS:1 [Paraglomus brasilianum]